MGIFDIFTGNAAKQAANQQRSYLDQVQANAQPGINQAESQSLGYIGQGTGTASNYLTSGYGDAAGAINTGADAASGYLSGGANQALGYLGQGANSALGYIDQGVAGAQGQYGQARQDLQGGSAAYDPLSALASRYGAATSLGLDSLGANGAAGNSRALGAFQAAPGYNFQLDQGLEAINRRRNAGGMLASGNADRDAQTYGQGLANQEYGNWQNRLNSYINPELSATSGVATGRAGLSRDMANLGVSEAGLLSSAGTQRAGIASGLGSAQAGVSTNSANALAGLEGNRGSSLSDLFTRGGAAQAGLYSNEGQSLANLTQGAEGQRLGLTGAVLQPYNNTYGQEAAAQQQGSANLWNLGLNAAALGTGQYGKAAGASKNGFSLFGSG